MFGSSLTGFPDSLFDEFWRLHQAMMEEVFSESSAGGIRSLPRGSFPSMNIVNTADAVYVYLFAPGIDPKEEGKHELGSGPVVNRGATIHPRVFELLHDTAEQEGIPFTVEASGRATGTDADAIHLSRGGVPTGVVSIPLRYMHSPVELVELDDVQACARLVAAFALRLGAGTSFAR